jgi:hypothetical protein
MKKILIVALVIFLVACENERDNLVKKDPASTGIIYKGKLLETEAEILGAMHENSMLFNDYSKDANTDYLFDSQDELTAFIEKNYPEDTYTLMKNHFSDKPVPADQSKALPPDWSGFSLQYYNTYCNVSDQLCFLDPSFFPTGKNNNISASGCGYNAKSFGIGVPQFGKMTLTYYRNINCQPDFNTNCYPSSRTMLYNPGSYCTDVKLGSCLSGWPGLIPSIARSVKWSCTLTY